MTPRVSIVTTVYDRVACLRRCLLSVSRLHFRSIEHIVVSDHPEPDTFAAIAAVCREFKTPHLSLSSRTNDWGHSPAQAGLDAASGEFVCFLSDDNAYLPEHFGQLVAALDADPGVGFAYSSCAYNNRRELRFDPPIGAGIDLGQPLFRRALFQAHFNGVIPARGQFAWDWETIYALMDKGVKWKHVDALTFVFNVQAYQKLMDALA